MRYLAAWRMAKNGLINTETLPTGMIRVLVDEPNVVEEKTAVYCRVSSTAQKDTTLQTQKQRLLDYCAAKGYKVDRVILETASGLNDSRKQWLSLLTDPTISRIVVEHKDRFTRFGFNAYRDVLRVYGREIEVVNEVDDDKQDLIQDFVSIITSYCSRIYGNRRSKRKTEKIVAELRDASETLETSDTN